MASVINDPNGRKRILFIGADGKRRPIRWGKVSMKDALTVRGHVEELLAAATLRRSPDNLTATWISSLEDVHYQKLVAVGLAQPRQSLDLGPWLESYLAERTAMKPGSKAALELTKEKLVD